MKLINLDPSKALETERLLDSFSEEQNLRFFGTTRLDTGEDFLRFTKWLSEGKHAGMSFLENNQKFRKDPAALEPGLTNAAVFGLPYYQGDSYGDVLSDKNSKRPAPRFAQYSRFKDYHKLLRTKANLIVEKLKTEMELEGLCTRVVVDSAPVLERALARRTISGFTGKNTLFIDPRKGSFFLLFSVFWNLDLDVKGTFEVDNGMRSSAGGCGSCRRCSVHCPTGALDKAYSLDARKCISYYTIEHRGMIPLEYWSHLKLYVFGCDICQLVCPYNRGIKTEKDLPFHEFGFSDIFEVAVMNQNQYETWFGGTPLTRAKIWGLKRNAFIHMVVCEHPRVREVKEHFENSGNEMLMQTATQSENYCALKKE